MSKCNRCIAQTHKKTQCKLKTCKFSPFCWIHSPVRVGKGLFGNGLIAKRDIKKNEVIANYKQCPIMIEKTRKNKCHLWTDGRRGSPIYDGSDVKKCIGGMANASKSGKPTKNADIRSSGLIRAIKPIKKGKEIYVTYGAGFWKQCPDSYSKSKSKSESKSESKTKTSSFVKIPGGPAAPRIESASSSNSNQFVKLCTRNTYSFVYSVYNKNKRYFDENHNLTYLFKCVNKLYNRKMKKNPSKRLSQESYGNYEVKTFGNYNNLAEFGINGNVWKTIKIYENLVVRPVKNTMFKILTKKVVKLFTNSIKRPQLNSRKHMKNIKYRDKIYYYLHLPMYAYDFSTKKKYNWDAPSRARYAAAVNKLLDSLVKNGNFIINEKEIILECYIALKLVGFLNASKYKSLLENEILMLCKKTSSIPYKDKFRAYGNKKYFELHLGVVHLIALLLHAP